MSFVQYKKHRVFRETEDVTFYDISVEDSNASDLVVHNGTAISPPNDIVGAKQFYIHYHQVDHNRVLSGTRIFELVNIDWKFPKRYNMTLYLKMTKLEVTENSISKYVVNKILKTLTDHNSDAP